MANETTDDMITKLDERVARLERLAPHHRAHINALEALLLQVLPITDINYSKLNETLSALLPDQSEAKQSALDRTEVLLEIDRANET